MKKQTSASKPSQRKGSPNAASEMALDGVVGEGAELHLQLPGFEGPFDLLLHLIEEHELDILNIPVAFVTDRYLQYLALMQELNIDVAADYLVMAATLAHLKSRLLLPTPPADDDADADEAELDPRAELIRRLLEYQKYKQAAEQLANRSVLGRDTFARGALPEIVEGPAPLAPVGVFKLLEAFQKILVRAKTVLDHHIEFERLSITDRINQLVDRLRDHGRLDFVALFEGQCTRAELIVTFLALLEMTRLRLTNVYQEHALAPIVIELAVSDVDQAVAEAIGEGSVEDSGNAASAATVDEANPAGASEVPEGEPLDSPSPDETEASSTAVSDEPPEAEPVEETPSSESDDAEPPEVAPSDGSLASESDDGETEPVEETPSSESDDAEPPEVAPSDGSLASESDDGGAEPVEETPSSESDDAEPRETEAVEDDLATGSDDAEPPEAEVSDDDLAAKSEVVSPHEGEMGEPEVPTQSGDGNSSVAPDQVVGVPVESEKESE